MSEDTRPDGCRFRLGLGGRKPMQTNTEEIKEQTIKQLFSRINEELDELKAVVLREVTTRNRLDDIADGVDDDTDTDIADKAIDTITAITTMLETLGINAEIRNENSPKCEVTNNG